jgi:hypothetical protein
MTAAPAPTGSNPAMVNPVPRAIAISVVTTTPAVAAHRTARARPCGAARPPRHRAMAALSWTGGTVLLRHRQATSAPTPLVAAVGAAPASAALPETQARGR